MNEVRLTATEAKMLDGLGPLRVVAFNGIRKRAYVMSEAHVATPDDVAYPPGVTYEDKNGTGSPTPGTAMLSVMLTGMP